MPPQTLPAGFTGWDKPPDTLPANFSQWDEALPGAAKPNVAMQTAPLSTAQQAGVDLVNKVGTMASHAADAGKSLANDVYDVSTPNIATQLYRKLQGKPNSLDKIPAKAVGAFFTAAGLPEGELAEGAAAASDAASAAPAEATAKPVAEMEASAAGEAKGARPPSVNADAPRTLSGESTLRQVLTGQDTDNLMKIAKSRGINVTQESQLRPALAGPRLINKIMDDFSDDELDNLRSTYIENTRMGKHNFGDIGAEAQKTLSMQTYFPDVKIPQSVLSRTRAAITRNAPQSTAAESSDDLTGILQESLRRAKSTQAGASQ